MRLADAIVVTRRCITVLCDQIEEQYWAFVGFPSGLLAISLLVSTRARYGDIGIPHNAERDPNIEPASLALQICENDLRLNPGALSLSKISFSPST